MSSTGATGYRDMLRRIATTWKDMYGPMLGGFVSKLVGDPDGNFTVVHDGASLARELQLHDMKGIASILLDAACTQGKTRGELVPDLVVLACDLVIDGMALIEVGVPPRVVLAGFDAARRTLLDVISTHSKPAILEQATIASRVETTLARALDPSVSRHLARLVAGRLHRCAVASRGTTRQWKSSKTLAVVDCENTLDIVLSPGGRILDSFLVHGVAMEHEPLSWPSAGRDDLHGRLHGARVAIVSGELYFEKRKHEFVEMIPHSVEDVQAMRDFWTRTWEQAAMQLAGAGVMMLFTERGIDDALVSAFLSRQPGGLVFRRVPRKTLDRLARASGANIVPVISSFHRSDTGVVDRVDILEKRGKHVFLFTCNGDHDTVVLRGGSHDVCQAVEANLRLVIAGELERWKGIVSGYTSVLVRAVVEGRNVIPRLLAGKTMLAALAFMNAVEKLHARCLMNAGLDPLEINHQGPLQDAGLGSLQAMIETACAVASKLLRVDGIVQRRLDTP